MDQPWLLLLHCANSKLEECVDLAVLILQLRTKLHGLVGMLESQNWLHKITNLSGGKTTFQIVLNGLNRDKL